MSDAANSMDRIYRWQTGIYDVTRKKYLLGRDLLVETLAPPLGGRVLEIGCGTARNLIRCAKRWPTANCFGVDVSHVMLEKARREVSRAELEGRVRLARTDASELKLGEAFATTEFDRIYFSYTLSMIPDWHGVLDRAAALLPPKGVLMIVDFGDQSGLPRFFRTLLRRWLMLFQVYPCADVEPVLREIADRQGLVCHVVQIYRGYAFIAALTRP
jgi:S-adenosylmethionine-diacylgycerolhomoserine-N-methlytransferase